MKYADRPRRPVHFTIDEETRQQVTELAHRLFEGNSSRLIRELVRKEYARLQKRLKTKEDGD